MGLSVWLARASRFLVLRGFGGRRTDMARGPAHRHGPLLEAVPFPAEAVLKIAATLLADVPTQAQMISRQQ